MWNVLITAILLVILSEGVGAWILKILKIENDGFSAPYGAAVLFCALEVFYLPILIKHGSYNIGLIMTMVVLVASVVLWCLSLRYAWKNFLRPSLFIVLFAAGLYTFLYVRYGSQIPSSDLNELFVMVENVNAEHINLDVYSLQGYTLFGSVLSWIFPGDMNIVAYILGVYAEMILAMFVLNVVQSFKLENPWLRFTLICFAIFYAGFYSWKITGAFHGSNWRIIFIAEMIFVAYEWLKKRNEQIKYFMLIITGAGMFCSSGFLMIAIDIFYCIAVYLFRIQKIRSLFDLSTFMIPVVIYLFAWMYSKYEVLAWIVLVGYTFFCFYRYKRSVYHRMIWMENMLIEYAWQLFYIAIPLVFIVCSFVLRYGFSSLSVPYTYYIHYLEANPMRSYMLMSSSPIDLFMMGIRWCGLIIFLLMAETKEDRLIRSLFLGMVVFFVNPLCMGMLGKITGMDMYADAFDILFNPFTDLLLFISIYRLFQWQVFGQWVLELCLVISTGLGHIGSYMGTTFGLYTDLVQSEEETMVQEIERDGILQETEIRV